MLYEVITDARGVGGVVRFVALAAFRRGGEVGRVGDSRFVQPTKKVDAKQIELPMYDTVMTKIGKPIVFNICVLGALIGITELVKPESILKILRITSYNVCYTKLLRICHCLLHVGLDSLTRFRCCRIHQTTLHRSVCLPLSAGPPRCS